VVFNKVSASAIISGPVDLDFNASGRSCWAAKAAAALAEESRLTSDLEVDDPRLSFDPAEETPRLKSKEDRRLPLGVVLRLPFAKPTTKAVTAALAFIFAAEARRPLLFPADPTPFLRVLARLDPSLPSIRFFNQSSSLSVSVPVLSPRAPSLLFFFFHFFLTWSSDSSPLFVVPSKAPAAASKETK
jgi:hypothetical protein